MGPQDAHHFLFYAPELDPEAADGRLEGDEHGHLSRALRMRAGEALFVTNGRGHIVRGQIENVGGDATTFRIVEVLESSEPTPPTVLALACLRRNAFEQAVKQCTELGVTGFVPFASSKCHVLSYSRAFLDRLDRIALGAMKQAFRPTLPTIGTPVDFDALVAAVRDYDRAIVGDPSGPRLGLGTAGGSTLLIIGPEGGLTPDEIDRLVGAGASGRSAARHRLRSETAAAALASLVLTEG